MFNNQKNKRDVTHNLNLGLAFLEGPCELHPELSTQPEVARLDGYGYGYGYGYGLMANSEAN